MKLVYYTQNNNFGDALNPLIFQHHIPEFFDDDDSEVMLGIGSIIHFNIPRAKHIAVFSSGFAYGQVPSINNSYNVLCVRGPLTAKKLGLDSSLAITDGAALLKTISFAKEEKVFDCSFIPHHESAGFFDWKRICDEAGYNYIDPLDDHDFVIKQLLRSKLVIAEAMHGAIVSDTLRVPWIPLKIYPSINEFKWHDWTSSLDMEYRPNLLSAHYNKATIEKMISIKLKNRNPALLIRPAAFLYKYFQDSLFEKGLIRKFSQLHEQRSYLSNEGLLNTRIEQLLGKLSEFKSIYKK